MDGSANAIRELLERGSRVLGLRLCFHDHQHRAGLPPDWMIHRNPACMTVKARQQVRCARFCGVETPARLAGLRGGCIQTCPFGHTDIAVAVEREGSMAGVLFAGVCWTGTGPPPREGMAIPPDDGWLRDRQVMLQALARQMGNLLAGAHPATPTRAERILAALTREPGRAWRLRDLGNMLALSPSRTGRLVKERFGQTFPQLLTRVRLEHAARLLRLTDEPAGAIALDLGFADQSHFTRLFRRRYGLPPSRYRAAKRGEV